MGNLLTGDYEAVLQVSAGTINRLLADMHQNAGGDPKYPSFPHSVHVRLGDTVAVDGVRGTAWAQVGAPRIELIDGATDRFIIEVAVRVYYEPDPGTEPLPRYINGTIRAVYELKDIDPDCPGWRYMADRYLWIRVVEDSIAFDGVSASDDDWLFLEPVDEAVVQDRILRQLRLLLVFGFEPDPHEVDAQFRRGSFRCINEPVAEIDEMPGLPLVGLEVPVGGSAVVLPAGLHGEVPEGSALATVEHVLLAGHDFALAVGVQVIMGAVNNALEGVRTLRETIVVTASGLGVSVSTEYDAAVTNVSAVWAPLGSFAVIHVTIDGEATCPILPDVTFRVTQPIQVEFDGANISLSAGNTLASVTGTIPGDIKSEVAKDLADRVQSEATTIASKASSSFTQLGSALTGLEKVVGSMAADAHAGFEEAGFYLSGIVIRGWVSVAARRRPVVTFDKVGSEMLWALGSWIPGGRIDKFEWSWTWSGFSRPPGEAVHDDRFVLRRQPGQRGKFGLAEVSMPVPGLDGTGRVCLRVVGVVTDDVTGELVPVDSRTFCTRFGFLDMFRPGAERLFVKQLGYDSASGLREPPSEALLDVTASGRPSGGTNTLIVSLGRRGLDEDPDDLIEGLTACRREDAGLVVVLLLPEGAIAAGGASLGERQEGLARRLGAPVLINEDVDGAWSRTFFLPDEGTAFRLLTPDGGVLWSADGVVAPDELAEVMDGSLHPSPPPEPRPIQGGLEDALRSPRVLGTVFDHPEQGRCPRWSGLRSNVDDLFTTVFFTQAGSTSIEVELHRLRQAQTEDEPGFLIVLDGADDEEADRVASSLGPAFTVVADEDGSRARRIGVRWWPTVVTLTDRGSVPEERSRA